MMPWPSTTSRESLRGADEDEGRGMSPRMKQRLRAAGLATLGMFIGLLVSGLIPESVTGSVRGWARDFASGIVSMGATSTFTLTIGLLAVCTALLACCFVFEVAALLVIIRKASRDESTDGPGRLLVGVERVADPLALGAMGALLIAVLAFEGRWTGMFAAVPWIGPAALLVLLTGAFIKTLLKKKMLDQFGVDTKRKG